MKRSCFCLIVLLIGSFMTAITTGVTAVTLDTASVSVGKHIPEMVFHNVINSPRKKISTADLAGKPLILYFFSTVCHASFTHFSEVNGMYSRHKRDLNLLMIGLDLNDNVRDVYRMYQAKYDLKLPVAFDKIYYKRYRLNAVPKVVWIDNKGFVHAITNALTEESVKQFLEGKELDMMSYDPKEEAIRRAFNAEEPFLTNGNGGSDDAFVQRSLLSEWRIGMPKYTPSGASNANVMNGQKFFQVLGRDLADLYRIAYFGRMYAWLSSDSVYGNYHYSPILEIGNKSKFDGDYIHGRNLYCYSQILPPERRTPKEMMAVMQRDLKNFFGYDAKLETRMMPYLSLVVADKVKKQLQTKGKRRESSWSLTHVDLVDRPVSELIRALSYKLNLVRNDLPLIDETGIQGNIDLAFTAIMTDFEDVKNALAAKGISIVKKERPMKVIVIVEPAQQ